jgi:hypothetical protein
MSCDLLLIAGIRPGALKLPPLDRQWRAAWRLAPGSPHGDGHAGPRAVAAIETWMRGLLRSTPACDCA